MKDFNLLKVIPQTMFLMGVGLLSSNVSAADLVVDGSLCVGLDCPVSPAFGFDTIILQEDNLRILFNDVSSSASFPANDWRFILNDSTNGGANYFALEDATAGSQIFKVEAGAPGNSLYVDDGGRVGLGTNQPVVSLHNKTGNTPTLRLEQDGSSGFTSQTWDMASNETNFFIRDATNGSTLPFRIRPGAPTSSIDIAASGNVGIGDESPDASLNIERSDGTAKILVEETNATGKKRVQVELINNGPTGFRFTDNQHSKSWQFAQTNAGGFAISLDGSGGTELAVESTGQVKMGPGSTTNFDLRPNGDLWIPNGGVKANGIFLTSSRDSKTEIEAINSTEFMKKLSMIEIAEWRYKKANKNDRHISPMAEDFYALFKLGPDNKHINPNDLASIALVAAKELQKENTDLKKRLDSLEKLVTNIVSGKQIISENGDKVALYQ